ncbi:glycosyltransferase family 4 protein [Microbacterium kribbense]|uniref:Glycosyltransferase family 4 protein n=1 Tax=Microbacterium kribbense TaxID=433645 RepID=A0ABP7G5C9_9MICO
MNEVHVIVPDGIDDPSRPSGGNSYDRRICAGLAAIGWTVHEHPAAGAWPAPDGAGRAAVAGVLAGIDDGSTVLIDGIIASGVPDIAASQQRLRVYVIMHMLRLGAVEATVLAGATGVIATSRWTKAELIARHALAGHRIHVVEPGVDAAGIAPGTALGTRLLCVAAVTPVKGHDVLVRALAEVADLPWRCDCIGALDLDPGFVDRVRRRAADGGIADRMRLVGARIGADLDAAYAAADLLVLCSRAETYGMVVTEALARGIPVIAPAVGGVPEALGGDGGRIAADDLPGILVPPGDSAALAAALRSWLGDAALQRRLRRAAQSRRATLADWTRTAQRLSDVLAREAV